MPVNDGLLTSNMKSPTQCILWENPELVAGPKEDRFDLIDTYVDDSRLIRRLLKCTECGQLYFYEFHEEVDWDAGEDPQYRTYIPVENDSEIEALKKASQFELLQYFPRLQRDFPKGAPAPKPPQWIGK
jgi:hypothetical protein